MGRRNARKHAFFLLFQLGFSKPEEYDMTKAVFLSESTDMNEEDKNFVVEEVDGVISNMAAIDEEIGLFAKGWTVERMSKVDLAILRLAVYEIRFSPDMPPSVAVNEAVELSKKYSSDEAPVFINGILGNIVTALEE